MNDQQHATPPPLPSSTARYGGLGGTEQPREEPELFPGEKALARTKAGSRDEMRVIRRHYNWVNMAMALLACLVLVLAALALAPRPEGDITREVEYEAVAQNVQQEAGFDLAVPGMPDGWHANAASFGESGTPAVETWYVSWVDGDDGWASLRQTDAEETPDAWAESYLEEFAETGESDLAAPRSPGSKGPIPPTRRFWGRPKERCSCWWAPTNGVRWRSTRPIPCSPSEPWRPTTDQDD